MRIISSTWQASAVTSGQLDSDDADTIRNLVEQASILRATEADNQYGQPDHAVSLRFYTPPGQAGRWAVLQQDPDGTELTDTDDEQEAVQHYVNEVRAIADSAGAVDAPPWYRSDVDGIDLAEYTYTVAFRDLDGQWAEEPEQAAVLGRATTDDLLPWGGESVNLAGAANALLTAAEERQNHDNLSAAIQLAAGVVLHQAIQRSAVRLTVAGTAATGAFESSQERELPAQTPSPEQVAAFLADLESANAPWAESH